MVYLHTIADVNGTNEPVKSHNAATVWQLRLRRTLHILFLAGPNDLGTAHDVN